MPARFHTGPCWPTPHSAPAPTVALSAAGFTEAGIESDHSHQRALHSPYVNPNGSELAGNTRLASSAITRGAKHISANAIPNSATLRFNMVHPFLNRTFRFDVETRRQSTPDHPVLGVNSLSHRSYHDDTRNAEPNPRFPQT